MVKHIHMIDLMRRLLHKLDLGHIPESSNAELYGHTYACEEKAFSSELSSFTSVFSSTHYLHSLLQLHGDVCTA